ANGNALSGRAVTWSSSNTSVANVDGSGLGTAAAAGSATITATSEGQSGTSSVTVTSPAANKFVVGDRVQTTDVTNIRNAPAVSGTLVGTQPAGAQGTVVGGPVLDAAGDQAIRWQVNFDQGADGWAAEAYLTKAVAVVPVSSVTVSPASATVQVGLTVQLTATPKDASGKSLSGRAVTWSSSNTAVASVDGNGLVTGGTSGSATITATSEGQSGTSSITVSGVAVSSVTVTPASANLPVGQTVQLTATPKDANGNPLTGRMVTWSSSNNSVASVTSSGLVSGGAAGSATITATSEGQSGTASITVTSVPVASVSVTPTSANVNEGKTVQLTATPKDGGGNPLTGRTITWSSSDNAVATVSSSGLVSGVVAGSATITATSEGQSGPSAITVTPPSAGATFGHVFIVTEENTNYSSVIGSSSMPYLNGLAQQYGLATQYYANTHPSIGNYFELSTGQIISNNDGFSTVQNVPNVVRSLLAAGKTWKSYAESIPNACYLGGDTGNYARKH